MTPPEATRSIILVPLLPFPPKGRSLAVDGSGMLYEPREPSSSSGRADRRYSRDAAGSKGRLAARRGGHRHVGDAIRFYP